MFRRSAILVWGAISLLAVSVWSQPARAEEGELIAQDPKAQINVRSLANTNADIIAAGSVGDRVQILAHSTGNDGLTWYRVKLSKSDQSGWIRGDLIKVFGSPKPPSSAKPTAAKPDQPSAAKPSAPVSLAPPQLSASAKSIAPSQPHPTQQPPEKSVAESGHPPPEKLPVAEPTQAIASQSTETPAAAVPTKTPPVPPASATTTTTIVAFKTSTYAVRIFSDAGQLRLNLFNRKTDRIALKAVPVESKSTEEGTLYHYGTDAKVTVVVPLSGQPTLIATALGETLKEAAETAPEAASPAP